jgi:hypothetical protein
VFVNWNRVDNGPGTNPRYNWSVIDQLIAPWVPAGKIVNLLLDGTGYQGQVLQAVPAWLQPQLQTVTCGVDIAPVYWQAAYVSNWQTYVAAVVRHYAANPSVGYIHVGVGSGAQTLVVGVRNAPCLARWNAIGYQSHWPAYVQQMIAFAGSLHSSKQLLVSFNDYSNDPPAAQIAQQDAAGGIGFGFSGLQARDVTAYLAHQPCNQTNWCALYDQCAGKMPPYVYIWSRFHDTISTERSLFGGIGPKPGRCRCGLERPMLAAWKTPPSCHGQYSGQLLRSVDRASGGRALSLNGTL